MANKTVDEKNITAPEVAVENKTENADKRLVVELPRPYTFEGEEHNEIDLSGLGALTVQDAIKIQHDLFMERDVAAAVLCETTTSFACSIAAKASGQPVEFFKLMPRWGVKRVVSAVRAYLNVDADTENHVMRLKKAQNFEGKSYQEIDLSGIADLNSMNESEAENRLAREGFVVTENSGNYLYACVIASMATGLPEKFFTGLPLYEVLKLKNAVNDPHFFE